MKKSCIIILAFISALPLLAQEQVPSVTPGVIARISMITPAFVLEMAPQKNFSFTTKLNIRPRFWSENEEGGNQFHPYPVLNPSITLEPRYFFTQAYRNLKGKRTDYYCGWYIGIPFELDIPDLSFSLSSNMGFQGTFGTRWYWNASMGPGMEYRDARFKIKAFTNLGFGLILN